MSKSDKVTDREWMNFAHKDIAIRSGCTKVQVGAVIVRHGYLFSIGSNRAIPNDCRNQGCLRVQKYGDNAKAHRNPDDCRAIHAEIEALCSASMGLSEATMYVTRYPCEACARAIVAAGVKRVVYGRKQAISEMTKEIFAYGGVTCDHMKDWDAPDCTN